MKNRMFSKYRTCEAETSSARPHMIYTEAQTLDEALAILASKKRADLRTRTFRRNVKFSEQELGPKKISLPKLKFMGNE